MSARFVSIDRETPLLLPVDLREWVRQDDLVHFILDSVAVLPLSQFRVNSRGTGSEQYPPRMMLALLIYCYVSRTFSSRAIENLTYSHVSVRYLCANTHPDHDTICTFRRDNKALLQETFVKVLELAAEMKLAGVGTVAIDGTKIAANASKHNAVSYARAGELIEQLELEVGQLMAKAEAADSAPLQDGLSIPDEITRREERIAKLCLARAAIEERAREKQKAEQAKYEERVARREELRTQGKPPRGREPKAPTSEPEPKDQYNFTDPESRIMKAGNGEHYEQAYNAQVVVDVDSLLIVAQRVTNACNDKAQLQPSLASIPASMGQPETVLVDSGFYSEKQIKAVEYKGEREDGEPIKTGITVYAALDKESHHVSVADLEARPEPEPPAEGASPADVMRHRLKTAAGKELYKMRKQTVEPVIGIIKDVLGFRRFLLRGEEKVSLEWTLVTLAWNFKRLHTLKLRQQTA